MPQLAAAVRPYASSWSPTVLYAAVFIVLFIALVFAWGWWPSSAKAGAMAGLRPVDRVLGACFGPVRGVVLLLVLTLAVQAWALAQRWLVEPVVCGPAAAASVGLCPAVWWWAGRRGGLGLAALGAQGRASAVMCQKFRAAGQAFAAGAVARTYPTRGVPRTMMENFLCVELSVL